MENEPLGKSCSHCDASVIIPNWNGMESLPECLRSLTMQTSRDFEVIIIDNGSKDDSVHYIKKEYPWIRLIELSENTGFAAACNTGLREAKSRYAALLNNDTVVSPRWLECLLETAESDSQIGMVASKILLDPETREIDSAGMLIYPDGIGRQRGRGETDRGQFEEEEEVLFPSACAALYRMEMLRDIGLFDTDFFAYGEDTDMALRGRWAGWKAIFSPCAVVYHKYSMTGGKYTVFKAFHVERNRIWVAVKNFPLSWLLRMPLYAVLRYIVQLYGTITGRGSAARFRESASFRDMVFTVIGAHAAALRRAPAMLKKRKGIRRRLSSNEFAALLSKHRIPVTELVFRD